MLAKARMPPSLAPAAPGYLSKPKLSVDRVPSDPVLPFGGRDFPADLLRERPGEKSSHGMGLPASSLDQLIERRSTFPFQEIEYSSRLAALPRGGRHRAFRCFTFYVVAHVVWFPCAAEAGFGHHMNHSAPEHKQVERREIGHSWANSAAEGLR